VSPGVTGQASAHWASHIAERLPLSDILSLARAVSGGADAVRGFRGQASAPIVREACDEVLTRLANENPAYLAGLLAGAGTAIRRARQRQSIDVVWTGPESGIATGRLTAATIIDLIGQARRQILLVSYAAHTEPNLDAALTAAAGRGVQITLLAERHADNPAYAAVANPFPALSATRLNWPAAQRPPGASLHAKIIVVDDEIALIGSANLTNRAMESNLECGILIRGGPQPPAIRAHLTELRAEGHLQRL